MDQQPIEKPIENSSEPHKVRAWMGVTALILIVVLAGLYAWKRDVFFKRPAPVNNQETPITNEPAPQSFNKIYYYTSTGGTFEKNKFSVYAVRPDLAASDELITEGTGFPQFDGPYVDSNTILFSNAQSFYELNTETKKTTKLFSFAEKTDTRAAKLSHNKKFVAYGVNTEDYNRPDPNSAQLWLYDTASKKQTKLVDTQPLGIYQGYSVQGWSSDDRYIIVTSLGGDAGAIWGDVMRIDSTNGKIEKVAPLPENRMSAFITGQLSPDGENWLYIFCEKPLPQEDIGDNKCPEGEELFVYNFKSKQKKSIYRNTLFGDNIDRDQLRSILNMVWQDDQTITLVVPSHIYRINYNGGMPELIYEFDRYQPQKIFTSYLYLISSAPDYFIYSADSENRLYNLKTKKAITIGSNNPNDSVTIIN